MEIPNEDLIKNPMLDPRYEIEIEAIPADIFPWSKQVGYHQGGWYIDTWRNVSQQKYSWPNLVPVQARGTFKLPVNEILSQYQDLSVGDIIPDGSPGSVYSEVVDLDEDRLLQLFFATTHSNDIAPNSFIKPGACPEVPSAGLLS